MATDTRLLVLPAQDASGTLRTAGLGLAALALGAAAIGFAGSLQALGAVGEGAAGDVAAISLWTFGLATAAFGTAKLGIASVLLAIIRQIRARIDSLAFVLPGIMAADASGRPAQPGELDTPYGPATATERAPASLPIHRLARLMWAPMLAMGVMAVYGGLLLSLVAAGTVATDPGLAASQRAWVQGLQFLGEGLLLSGVSFLLATIMGTLRTGGAGVQESVGVTVHTLRMPSTAKAFVALMMAGLMIEIAQFVGYAVVAGMSDRIQIAAASAWLGPLRELGLGLLLAGIVLALATIARVLDFQSARISPAGAESPLSPRRTHQ